MSEKLLVMNLVHSVECEVDGDKVLVDLDSLIDALTADEVSDSINNLGENLKIAKKMLLREDE